jgi:hypothetical protein
MVKKPIRGAGRDLISVIPHGASLEIGRRASNDQKGCYTASWRFLSARLARLALWRSRRSLVRFSGSICLIVSRMVKKPIRGAGPDLITVILHGASLEIGRRASNDLRSRVRVRGAIINKDVRFGMGRTSYSPTTERRDMITNSRGVSVVVT